MPSPTTDRIPLVQLMRNPRTLILASTVGIGPFALTALLGTYLISYATAIGYGTVWRISEARGADLTDPRRQDAATVTAAEVAPH
ncbi:hypothetical protein [Nocardia salmonicida]|uniref:hypothetical protein n=1 Tax=Nocardia salmonicida TaxID=53431 RepID=UPI0037B93822